MMQHKSITIARKYLSIWMNIAKQECFSVAGPPPAYHIDPHTVAALHLIIMIITETLKKTDTKANLKFWPWSWDDIDVFSDVYNVLANMCAK